MVATAAPRLGQRTFAGRQQILLRRSGVRKTGHAHRHAEAQLLAVEHDDLRGAQRDFDEMFTELALKKDLFIVTDFDELERQPFLQEKLSQYPIYAAGDGYVIYDLQFESAP